MKKTMERLKELKAKTTKINNNEYIIEPYYSLRCMTYDELINNKNIEEIKILEKDSFNNPSIYIIMFRENSFSDTEEIT